MPLCFLVLKKFKHVNRLTDSMLIQKQPYYAFAVLPIREKHYIMLLLAAITI